EVISLEVFRDSAAAIPVKPDSTGKPVRHAPTLTAFPGDTLVSIRDTVPLPADAVDTDGDLAGYSWDCDGDGHPEDSAVLAGSWAKIRGFKRAYADSGTRVCVLKVWDREGLSVQGKVKIHVITDPPSASAGQDTTVMVESPILLHARGVDAMGPIVYMEWKIGNEEFKRIPQAETSIKAPAVPGDLVCVLRVTDSDGLTALDTLLVKVIYSPDDTLSDLRVNLGKLQPAFRKDVHEYLVNLGPEDSLLVLSPQVNEPHAQATVQAANVSSTLPTTVPIRNGDNFITVQVTAQDGSTLQYSVTAHR
ncbi:MAG: multidomain protein with s-layer y region, hyr domain, partial [Verrucomicrobiales bacterium]|nr:multidomain protein with s-layer y region, hyr domain [Verrucomicrobiales bacterium]